MQNAQVYDTPRKLFTGRFAAKFPKLKPQRTRDKNWRITAAHKADNQREGKIFSRLAAEEKQSERRK